MAQFYRPIVKPASVVNQLNGEIDLSLMRQVAGGSRMLTEAAKPFDMLCHAFLAETGKPLTYTGTYRSYESQQKLFLSRYRQVPFSTYIVTPKERRKRWEALPPSSKHHADNPSESFWVMKQNANGSYPAMAAVPGRSNHGWGLSADLALGSSPSAATSLDAAARRWLEANLERFGFTYEVPSEPWHVTYFVGDKGVAPVEAVTIRPTLRRGSSGLDVRFLQDRLNVSGEKLSVDGQFGGMTEAAVRRFQRASGLVVDGVVGPRTWAKLTI
jgi:LAS superfamily LD-carboxypeptidase LdcB